MKIPQLSIHHKIAIIAALAIIILLIIWLFVLPKKEKQAPDKPTGELDLRIDSVLNTLNDIEKTSLLLLPAFEIEDSNDYGEIRQKTIHYGLSAWMMDVVSFEYHQTISDSLSALCKAPSMYAVYWDSETPDGGKFPDFHAVTGITDTAFLSHFSKQYAALLTTYGIDAVFLPQLFKDTTSTAPHISSISTRTLAIQHMFSSLYFYSGSVYLNTSSGKLQIADSLSDFPGSELFGTYLTQSGFSSYSSSTSAPETDGIHICQFNDEFQLVEFLNSTCQMLLISSTQIEMISAELIELYSQQEFRERIDQKIRKIIGLRLLQLDFNNNRQPLNPLKITSTAYQTLQMQLTEHIACLVKNEKSFFPLLQSGTRFIISEQCKIPHFHSLMKSLFSSYAYTIISSEKEAINTEIRNLTRGKSVSPCVFIISDENDFQFNYKLLDSLQQITSTGLIVFSETYSQQLNPFFNTILVMGDISVPFQQTAFSVVTGSTDVNGTYNTGNPEDLFIFSSHVNPVRLKQSFPEDAGLDGEFLTHAVDSIVNDAIQRGAFPGCQVFAAKKGKIIFNKAYGWHSYDKSNAVSRTDLYDIASVTKIAATTIAAMRMSDQGRLSINEPLKRYFKDLSINYTRIKPDTNVVIDTLNLNIVDLKKMIKAGKIPKDTFRIHDTLLVCIDSVISRATPTLNIFTVPLRYMLMHYSGISPSLPILPFIQYRKYYLKDRNIEETDSAATRITWREIWEMMYTTKRTDSSKVQIADNFWMKDRWKDTLWERTKELGVSGRKFSQYTDLNMILVQLTIDTINKSTLDKYLQREIYGPMGLKNIMYKPLDHNVPRNRIAPTENDTWWRRQVLRGHVHDPSAALLGGISGNAGLFASAEDLGVLFQMLLNGGTYAGRRYLSENIISFFTQTHEETGRGLGFDKYSPKNIVAPSASRNTYGHTGFTGCCVWVDPDSELVFVFLSNRVHPNVKNQRINGLKVRQKVHQAFYDAEIKP